MNKSFQKPLLVIVSLGLLATAGWSIRRLQTEFVCQPCR